MNYIYGHGGFALEVLAALKKYDFYSIFNGFILDPAYMEEGFQIIDIEITVKG